MALRHHDDDIEIVESESSSVREPFGVAQAVALAAGLLMVVIGAVGLLRAGLDDPTGATVDVAGLSMTALMAMIELAIGLIALAGAATRGAARLVLMVLGPVLVASGIVAMVQPIDALGIGAGEGLVHLVVGAVMLAGAILTPNSIIAERRFGETNSSHHHAA